MKDLMSEYELLPCIVVLKEKIVPFGKTLFMGRGARVRGSFKKFNVFGGSERKCLK